MKKKKVFIDVIDYSDICEEVVYQLDKHFENKVEAFAWLWYDNARSSALTYNVGVNRYSDGFGCDYILTSEKLDPQ